MTNSLPWGHTGPNDEGLIRNGRYYVPGPDGVERSYTRITNHAKELASLYGVHHWEQRLLAHGIGLRPDLAAIAASIPVDDKKAWPSVIEDALKAGGRDVAANQGTALHGFCAGLLTGSLQWADVLPEYREDVEAYFRELKRVGLRQVPELTEVTVRNDDYDTVGTLDTGLMDHEGALVVGDIKTGAKLDLAQLSFAIQLALYARARWMLSNGVMVPAPQWRTDYAIVIHVPHGSGQAFSHRVNLDIGYAAARVASESRALNSLNNIMTPYIPFLPNLGGPVMALASDWPAPVPVELADPAKADPYANVPAAGYMGPAEQVAAEQADGVEEQTEHAFPMTGEIAQGFAQLGSQAPGEFDQAGQAPQIATVGQTFTFPSGDAARVFASRLAEHDIIGTLVGPNLVAVTGPGEPMAQTLYRTLESGPVPVEAPGSQSQQYLTLPGPGYDHGGPLQPGFTIATQSKPGYAITSVEDGEPTELPVIGRVADLPPAPATYEDQRDELLNLVPKAGQKAAMQTLAKSVDDRIKAEQYAKNIALCIVKSDRWPPVRDAVLAKLREEDAARPKRGKAKEAPALVPPTPAAEQPSEADVAAALSGKSSTEILQTPVDNAGPAYDARQAAANQAYRAEVVGNVHTETFAPETAPTAKAPGVFVTPVENRTAAWYSDALPHVGTLPELFGLATEAGQRGVPIDPELLYRVWSERAKTKTEIWQMGEHAKAAGFTFPAGLLKFAMDRGATLPK